MSPRDGARPEQEERDGPFGARRRYSISRPQALQREGLPGHGLSKSEERAWIGAGDVTWAEIGRLPWPTLHHPRPFPRQVGVRETSRQAARPGSRSLYEG